MAAGDQYRRIEPSDMLVFDGENNIVGVRSGKSDPGERRVGAPLTAQKVGALAAGAGGRQAGRRCGRRPPHAGRRTR